MRPTVGGEWITTVGSAPYCAECPKLRDEAERLRRLIREYLAARREVAHRDPRWSERLHVAEAALLAEVKS